VSNPLSSLTEVLTRFGRSVMTVIRRLRKPLTDAACSLFIRLRINQTHITAARMLIMIGFYFAWVDGRIGLALGVMLSAWLLDCVDGDLSRRLGNDNAIGEFEDYFADNLVFLIYPLALSQSGYLAPALAGLMIFSASSVLWMAVRKQSASGDSLVFHPQGDLLLRLSRGTMWVLMYLFIFFRWNAFDAAYAVLGAALGTSVLVNYFQIIRSRLRLAMKK
jgi:phosphatidylglycerophosphate synthase